MELQGQHQRGCGHHPTGHHTHSARGGQNYDLTGQREPFSWQAPLWVCYRCSYHHLTDDGGHAAQEGGFRAQDRQTITSIQKPSNTTGEMTKVRE